MATRRSVIEIEEQLRETLRNERDTLTRLRSLSETRITEQETVVKTLERVLALVERDTAEPA